MFEKTVKFISEESFVQHVNITSNTIKNDLINLIKIENYVQQLEGTSLIMRGSIWISLAFELIIFTNLKNIISDKWQSIKGDKHTWDPYCHLVAETGTWFIPMEQPALKM
jgi:hypothetical protein